MFSFSFFAPHFAGNLLYIQRIKDSPWQKPGQPVSFHDMLSHVPVCGGVKNYPRGLYRNRSLSLLFLMCSFAWMSVMAFDVTKTFVFHGKTLSSFVQFFGNK